MKEGTLGKKVMVAMSGGVDSSVAAALLLDAGYEVYGATMQLWPQSRCCSIEAAEDARRVADHLGIPYYVFNLKDAFNKYVIGYFIKEYKGGRTPNPCIACNRHLKFGALLDKAISMGMDHIATGHYARTEYSATSGRYLLWKSAAGKKDQTYVLYDLTQDQLKRVLFPLGDYNKDQVREIACRLGLPTAKKQESQEICFIEDDDYAKFIMDHTGSGIQPGDFVDAKGDVLGRHKGIIHYTIGQRKGLGKAFGRPMFVTGIDAVKNTVVLGEEDQLFTREFTAGSINWISIAALEAEIDVKAKIRYNAIEAPARIIPEQSGKARVVFAAAQRAATPGQSAVFYDGGIVLGGGIIEQV